MPVDPFWRSRNGQAAIYCGDAREVLRTLPEKSVHCVVTSPPYWQIRDFGVAPTIWGGDSACDHDFSVPAMTPMMPKMSGEESEGTIAGTQQGDRREAALHSGPQEGALCSRCGAWVGCLGLEPTPQLFVEHLVEVFREVRRVLRDDGTLWLNMGDIYANDQADRQLATGELPEAGWAKHPGWPEWAEHRYARRAGTYSFRATRMKPKDLVGIPWMAAFALRNDGWWLRSDVIWAKGVSGDACKHGWSGNPIPESVTDRPVAAHEHVFLLAKNEQYFYDADAVREPYDPVSIRRYRIPMQDVQILGRQHPAGRNLRDVWTISNERFPGAHFATFSEKLVKLCILAGCPSAVCAKCGKPRKQDRGTVSWTDCGCNAGWVPGTVLDPFVGSGTTAAVAVRYGRNAIGIDLNPDYCKMAGKRVYRELYRPRLSFDTEAADTTHSGMKGE